jgi:hypothetical protein
MACRCYGWGIVKPGVDTGVALVRDSQKSIFPEAVSEANQVVGSHLINNDSHDKPWAFWCLGVELQEACGQQQGKEATHVAKVHA